MKLISPDFNDGEFLKQEYSLSKEYGFGCAGKNIRPHLEWSGFSDPYNTQGTLSALRSALEANFPTLSLLDPFIVIDFIFV